MPGNFLNPTSRWKPPFGRTVGPADPTQYDLLQCAADVASLAHALGERRAVVVGHDLGAWVAYTAAQTRPDLFPALALSRSIASTTARALSFGTLMLMRAPYKE